jgi:hypothetical protein
MKRLHMTSCIRILLLSPFIYLHLHEGLDQGKDEKTERLHARIRFCIRFARPYMGKQTKSIVDDLILSREFREKIKNVEAGV